MKVVVITPADYSSETTRILTRRSGQVISMTDCGNGKVMTADVPLSDMRGHAQTLRGISNGRAQYAMGFETYASFPEQIATLLIDSFWKS
ncbi:MAG: elongation factor G [Cyanobacteriota bacterium]|nr:elongation factor G [Cyanobacteriota bacterium]